MSNFFAKMRKQRAVWWRRLPATRYGAANWDSPVEVRCRWEDVSETFTSETGEQVGCRSKVYVDRIMSAGDRLQRGTLDDSTPDDPLNTDTAFEIKRFEQLPDFRNRKTLFTAFC